MNRCTDQWHGLKKTSVPDALALLNVNDACHLERLAWAVYDGALSVGLQPELPGDHPWCTVLAGLHKHIYRGHDDAAHCPPHTLGSGTARSGLRHCGEGAGSALCEVGGDEHPGPGGGPEAAYDATLRHQPRGIGMDTHVSHPPTHL